MNEQHSAGSTEDEVPQHAAADLATGGASQPAPREILDLFEDYGHDPDLDENGICRVCGKFEPE